MFPSSSINLSNSFFEQSNSTSISPYVSFSVTVHVMFLLNRMFCPMLIFFPGFANASHFVSPIFLCNVIRKFIPLLCPLRSIGITLVLFMTTRSFTPT